MRAIVFSDDEKLSLVFKRYFHKRKIPTLVLDTAAFSTKNKDYFLVNDISYIIYLCINSLVKSNSLVPEDEVAVLTGLIKLSDQINVRVSIVFPYHQDKHIYTITRKVEEFVLSKKIQNTSIVYTGEIAGAVKLENLNDFERSSYLLKIFKNKILLPKNFNFNPVYVENLVSNVITNLFSLKVSDKPVILLSKDLGSQDIIEYVRNKQSVKTFINFNSKSTYKAETENSQKAIFKNDRNKILKKSFEDFHYQNSKGNNKKFSIEHKFYKLFIAIFFLIFYIFIFPFIILGVDVVSIYLAKYFIFNKQIYLSRNLSNIDNVSTNYLRHHYNFLKSYNIYPNYFQDLEQFTETAHKISVAIQGLQSLYISGKEIYQFIGGDYDTSFEIETNNFYLDATRLYESINFVELELKESKNFYLRNLLSPTDVKDLLDLNTKLLSLGRVVKALPKSLAIHSQPLTYALVLTDQAKSGPLGGGPKNIILVEFVDGKALSLEELSEDDIQSNLKGEFEINSTVYKYFKENQQIIDSSWNPNFSVSAEKIKKVIEKSLNRKIEGVFVMNREDYSTAEKLIFDKDSKQKFEKLFSLIGQNLAENKIQLYLNNHDLEEDILDIGWGNVLYSPNCSDCYKDTVYPVEVSLGSGNTNHLERKVNLEISLEENLIKRKMIYYLKNKSDQSENLLLRTFTNQEVGFAQATMVGKSGTKQIELEIGHINTFKEAMLEIRLEPEEVVAYIIEWESENIHNFDKYRLNFIKQPGIQPFPLKVLFKPWNYEFVNTDSKFELTNQETYEYNAVLHNTLNAELEINKE